MSRCLLRHVFFLMILAFAVTASAADDAVTEYPDISRIEEGIQGLKLPREVLDKNYYKNAKRIYPRVADAQKELRYAQSR